MKLNFPVLHVFSVDRDKVFKILTDKYPYPALPYSFSLSQPVCQIEFFFFKSYRFSRTVVFKLLEVPKYRLHYRFKMLHRKTFYIVRYTILFITP